MNIYLDSASTSYLIHHLPLWIVTGSLGLRRAIWMLLGISFPSLGGRVDTFQTFNGATREFHTVATFQGQRLEPLCTFLEDFCPWTAESL